MAIENYSHQDRMLPVHFSPSLRAQSNANPFIEVTDSIYMLARLSIFLYLIAAVFIGITSRDAAPNQGLRLLTLTISTLVTTLPLWFRIKGMGLLHPLYLLSALSFLKASLPGLAYSAIGLKFHGALPGASPNQISMLQIQVVALGAVSTVFMYLGYAATRGNRWTFIKFNQQDQRLILGSIAALIVGAVSLWLLMDLSGGFFEHLKNISRGQKARVWVKDGKYASIYGNLVLLVLVAPALWILMKKRSLYNPLLWLLCFNAVASGYLISGRRTAALTNVIALVACWVVRRRSLAVGRMVLIGLLVFLFVGLVGEFRRSNWHTSHINYDALTESSFQQALARSWEEIESRRVGGAIYAIVSQVPKKHPYRYATIYLSYFNRFIPRLIWPNKPRGVGIECAYVFFGRVDSGGIPPGGLGEAYWSGGIFGIAIVFFIWGVLLRCIGNFYAKFHTSSVAVLLYLATLTKLGPSEPQFRAWLYLVVPAVAMLTLAGIVRFNSGRK